MSGPEASRGRPRILVVDDEEIVLASARKILVRAGYDTEDHRSATEALDRLAGDGFDLVITDLMMPQMNGMQLMQLMRSRGLAIPVIMVTGLPTLHTAVEALRMGAVDYVAKPFRRRELLGPVARALSGSRERILAEPEVEQRTVEVERLVTGMVLYLPRHSWARYIGDGSFEVGVESAFIDACGSLVAMEHPQETDLVDQGYIGLWLSDAEGREHGVAMPLSGQVTRVNREAVTDMARLRERTWILRLQPHQLETEIGHLLLRP